MLRDGDAPEPMPHGQRYAGDGSTVSRVTGGRIWPCLCGTVFYLKGDFEYHLEHPEWR